MRLAARRLGPADEPVIPLVNIVLLLLIFFLLSGTLAEPEPVPVTPPVSARDLPEGGGPLTIWVGADGRPALADGPLDREALAAHVRARLAGNAQTGVRLVADAEADTATIVALAAWLQEAGAAPIALVTRRGPP
ncbi:MAG: biopolymer transporter ExbD [Alphaproteobacteria bacterium]|jgi:biopolymer transport protein ExbD|nr:biopolymer transporter ExbD [Alphaproteobacteria bacterium]